MDGVAGEVTQQRVDDVVHTDDDDDDDDVDDDDDDDDLRCIFSIKYGYFSHRNIGLRRRGIN